MTGPALLTKLREMTGAPRSEMMEATGYSTPRDDGTTRHHVTAFHEAIIAAQGTVTLTPSTRGRRRSTRGRRSTKIQRIGGINIARGVVEEMGWEPRQTLTVTPDPAAGTLTLSLQTDDPTILDN